MNTEMKWNGLIEVDQKELEATLDCLQQAMTLIDYAYTKLHAMEKNDD